MTCKQYAFFDFCPVVLLTIVIFFYNDDEQLKEILDTDEKIIDHADIVCQEEEINEDLEQGEEGRYYTVKKTGDQVVGSYLSWILGNMTIAF